MKKTVLTGLLLALVLFLLPLSCFAEEAVPGAGRPAGAVLPILANKKQTRECFFANGTPITIQEPTAETEGWVHDEEIQKALGNKLSPKKKPKTGSLISWQEGGETRYVYVSGNSKVFGGSLNASVQADVEITVKGTDASKSFPNVSFLFGG